MSLFYYAIHVLILFYAFGQSTFAFSIAQPLTPRGAAVAAATPFFHFPGTQQAENMIARSNGQILVTVDTAPELWQVNPFAEQTGGIVHAFEGHTSVFGIVELDQDVFYVLVSNFTGPPDYYGEGNVDVMRVDLRGYPIATTNISVQLPFASVTRVLEVPQAQLLDGLVLVNANAGLLLSGDAQTGTLYLLDVCRPSVTEILQSDMLRGTSNSATAGLAHIGINGMKYRDGWLYWTNTAKGAYGQLAIDNITGAARGNVTVLASYETDVDDLSFDAQGNQFISEDLDGVLFRPANATYTQNGSYLIAHLPGADANVFGRTPEDSCVLYSNFAGSPSGVASIDLGALGYCGR